MIAPGLTLSPSFSTSTSLQAPAPLARHAERNARGRTRFGVNQKVTVLGSTQTPRKSLCHAQNHFKLSNRFPILPQSKTHQHQSNSCSRGRQLLLPLHHGGDTEASTHQLIPRRHPGQVYQATGLKHLGDITTWMQVGTMIW